MCENNSLRKVMLRLLLKVCLTKSINFAKQSSAFTPILSFLLAHDIFLVLSLLEIICAYSQLYRSLFLILRLSILSLMPYGNLVARV